MTPITIASLMLEAFQNYDAVRETGQYAKPATAQIPGYTIRCYVEQTFNRQRKLGHRSFRNAFYLNGKRVARNVVQNVLIGHELDSE